MKRENDPNVTLKIPRPLYERLKQVIDGSGFHSVTEFAVYVLRDLVSHHAAQRGDPLPTVPSTAADPAAETDVQPLSPEEIEAIRKRLESLGYL
ncbi:MAG: CopG family transcriptional regulator [Actinomycetota bacterium]|nr:CopG family transcriptional regulator [Actinomycetota bacterium]